MTNEANKVKLTREVLFEAIGSISEDMLLKSEQHLPKKEPTAKRITLLVSMAAAIFIVCGAIVFLGILNGPNRNIFLYPQEALSGGCYQESTSGAAKPNYSTSTSAASKKPTSQTNIENIFEWALVFNEIEEPPQGDRAYIPGYFEEKLTSDLLEKILPEKLHKGMINSAVAGFDGEGTLVNLTMRVAYLGYDGEIFINVSEDESILKDYIITDDEKISCFCNGIYFTCYNYSSDHYEIYEAEAEIHGLYYHFEIKSLYQNRTNAEKIMKLTMESFTTFETAPDLSLITPSYTPPYENYALPYESAKNDETFGKYLPEAMPEGFTDEGTRRYIDSNENYLSTLYTKG